MMVRADLGLDGKAAHEDSRTFAPGDSPPMPLDLLAFYGSVRSDRQGIKAAKFILNRCRERGHQAGLIDACEDRLPLLDRMYKEYQPDRAPEVLRRLATRIKAADAFLI